MRFPLYTLVAVSAMNASTMSAAFQCSNNNLNNIHPYIKATKTYWTQNRQSRSTFSLQASTMDQKTALKTFDDADNNDDETVQATASKTSTTTTQRQIRTTIPSTTKNNKKASATTTRSFTDRFASSGMTAAAAAATAAVNAAVAMKSLEAPDVTKSYVTLSSSSSSDKEMTDPDGLPLVYNKEQIEKYWRKERGALNQRWGEFVGKAVPFLTKLVTLWIRDGEIAESEVPGLARRARQDLSELGPTWVKLGQVRKKEFFCLFERCIVVQTHFPFIF